MKTAELYCPSCDESYKIDLELDTDPEEMYCVLCGNQVDDFNIIDVEIIDDTIQDEFEFWD